jgi:hypothetical protein
MNGPSIQQTIGRSLLLGNLACVLNLVKVRPEQAQGDEDE